MSDVDYASRQDWSPGPAARPGRGDGSYRRSTKYFNAGNRTVIPRAVPGENFGASARRHADGHSHRSQRADDRSRRPGHRHVQASNPALVAKATQLGRNPAERLEQYVRLASEAQTGSQPIGTPVVSQPAPVIPTLAPPPYVNNPPQAPVLPSQPARSSRPPIKRSYWPSSPRS